MNTDPIADMLTRIRNAYATKKAAVTMPHSNIKASVLAVLAKNQYVESVVTQDSKPQKTLVVTLRYVDTMAAVNHIDRVSSPGRRVYTKTKAIKNTLAGYGLTIISTNLGVMTDKEARAKKIGGEIICRVW